jgi:geranylgeranyl pyrophosphate synthase/flavin-dependent dehydrogenase
MGLSDFMSSWGQPFTSVQVSSYIASSASQLLHAGGAGEARRGMVIPRRELDHALVQHAVRAGARFLPHLTSIEPIWHSQQPAGLRARGRTGELTLAARMIIIATGASRTLAQALNLVGEERPHALAMRGYVQGLRDLGETLEIYLDRDLLPGYAWIFPTGPTTANVGAGITLNGLGTAAGKKRLRMAFDRLLCSQRLVGSTPLGQPQGYPLRADFPDAPTHAERILVVGEAAGLVDPLTGEGIALALESGRLAATTAIAALTADDCSIQQLGTYTHALHERHAGYFADARELLARLDDPLVLDAATRSAQYDRRIGDAFRLAIADQQIRSSITLLDAALRDTQELPLAGVLFTLNAYKPWLERCRAYMLDQIRIDAPAPMIIEMVGRGKMLRALLVFLGCEAAGGTPAQVLAGAGGIELIHAASLVHDDIMDRSDVRRGIAALHTTLGEAQAIVCGDYLIAKAFRLLAESRAQNPSAHVVEAFIIGAESGIRACAGQFRDVGVWTAENLIEANYYKVIADKTAAAISGALRAGAVLAGGNQILLDALGRYGECVGLAFQIKDDLLDLSELVANDCTIDRKISLPLVHAFQHTDATGRQIIRQFLDQQEVSAIQMAHVLESAGALAYAERAAATLINEAITLARAIPHIEEVLEAFAHYAILRGQ